MKMTINELVEQLKYISEHELRGPQSTNKPLISIDEAHERADELLLKFIDNDEVTNTFNAIEKWYA